MKVALLNSYTVCKNIVKITKSRALLFLKLNIYCSNNLILPSAQSVKLIP